jgi:hypothetical protein
MPPHAAPPIHSPRRRPDPSSRILQHLRPCRSVFRVLVASSSPPVSSAPAAGHLRSTARAAPPHCRLHLHRAAVVCVPSPTAGPAQRAGWERGGAELRGKLSCAPKHSSSPPPLR